MAVPGSPAPPTADISVTVDAKVRQRLANATTYTPGVPGTRSSTATQLSSPTAAISGTSTVLDPFTGVISFQPGGSTLILSVTRKNPQDRRLSNSGGQNGEPI